MIPRGITPGRNGMTTTYGADWQAATKKANALRDQGAIFHRTIRSNVWWVDPVLNDPPSARPATYWVTSHPDGCFSCVCDTFLERKAPPNGSLLDTEIEVERMPLADG